MCLDVLYDIGCSMQGRSLLGRMGSRYIDVRSVIIDVRSKVELLWEGRVYYDEFLSKYL